ncbi:MAG: putative DNA binding domain-containing protein [Candidatus Caccosoma sp.]|nr:putative DNA binding domain-containing protein [Candidatus Caccosoma sp.]
MNLGNETENIEFKKSISELKEGIISIASMLNKNGHGILYFGVKNDGEIIGQEIGGLTLKNISQAIANFIKPQMIPIITVEYLDDKTVIKIEANGNDKPYSAYGRYYIRSSNEDREIAPNKLKELINFSYIESITKIEATNQFLTFNQLKGLYLNNGMTLNEETYKHNLNLLCPNGKYNLMADILSDSNSFSIKIARFAGIDKTSLIKRNEYGYKCLLLSVTQVLDYMEAINDTIVDVTGGIRIERKLFDFSCFREAWLNACLHNKWSRLTPPAVYIYSNRIEIISTGGLPADYSLDDFYIGRSKPVNLELQKIMGQLNYIEQTGHGVPLIVSKYGKQAFDISDNFITVTIPFSESKEAIKKDSNDISITQNKVLELIKSNSNLTISQITSTLNLGQTTINNALKQLKKLGYIERIGSNKTGYWKVL